MINLLTSGLAGTKIDLPFPHEAVRTTTPELTGQKRPLLSVVFLCPSKNISTELICIKSFMVGCIRHLSGWLVPVASCSNLVQSATQRLLPMVGGYFQNTGETAMRNYARKLTNHVSEKSKSRFNVFTRSGRSIARKVPFSTAIRLKTGHPELTIKFDSMELSS